MKTTRQVTAIFHPQAWVNDYAVPADPEGQTAFDVTPEIEAMGREAALALTDDDYPSDDLRHAASAPEWVREWSGPFRVEVAESIAAYYEAAAIENEIQRAIDAATADMLAALVNVAQDLADKGEIQADTLAMIPAAIARAKGQAPRE